MKLEETLTVIAFGLPDALARTLSTTNPAAALGEAGKGFRRLKGYRGMPKLLAALRAHDARLGISLATVQKAA